MFPPLYKNNEDDETLAYISSNRKSLKKAWQNKFEVLERTLEVVIAGVKEAKRQNVKSVELIWNLAGYVNTVSFDLAVTGERLMFEINPWKRRYFSRMAAVNIFEASLDLPNMSGKEFRNEVLALAGGDVFLNLLGEKCKKLAEFKKDHSSWLKEIRLYCAAHRDQNLSEQLNIISEISPTKVIKVMAEFDSILNGMGDVLKKGMQLHPKANA